MNSALFATARGATASSMLLVTVLSALRLIQLDTRDAALVVKLPLLHVHPNSPVTRPVVGDVAVGASLVRCLFLWILEPSSRNVFYPTIRKFSSVVGPSQIDLDVPTRTFSSARGLQRGDGRSLVG